MWRAGGRIYGGAVHGERPERKQLSIYLTFLRSVRTRKDHEQLADHLSTHVPARCEEADDISTTWSTTLSLYGRIVPCARWWTGGIEPQAPTPPILGRRKDRRCRSSSVHALTVAASRSIDRTRIFGALGTITSGSHPVAIGISDPKAAVPPAPVERRAESAERCHFQQARSSYP